MTLMNRDDWKHLEAAARSIGSALSLDVEILQHDEDYPQLQIADKYYVQWSTHLNKWLLEKMDEEDDLVQVCAAKDWGRVLSRTFQKASEEIVSTVIAAELLAQEIEAEKVANLRRVK